jgi:pimeloyl-ACP methyl ester carboxylesterase
MILFLAGGSLDDIAAKLAAFCHVYGITRRGFGASSRPDSGYTAQRSAEDVLQVIIALKLDHPVLAGHSSADSTSSQSAHNILRLSLA